VGREGDPAKRSAYVSLLIIILPKIALSEFLVIKYLFVNMITVCSMKMIFVIQSWSKLMAPLLNQNWL